MLVERAQPRGTDLISGFLVVHVRDQTIDGNLRRLQTVQIRSSAQTKRLASRVLADVLKPSIPSHLDL
jgi:hypothetical protein